MKTSKFKLFGAWTVVVTGVLAGLICIVPECIDHWKELAQFSLGLLFVATFLASFFLRITIDI